MLKNLLLFIGLLISIIVSFNNLSAETISLIPLKKPVLSSDEFNKKISKNIIKPIRKPKKDKIVSIEKKKIIKTLKETKLSFKIPKKKPSIAGINTSKISKYLNIIAKKTLE